MRVPHTNPVGLAMVPDSFSQRPQRHPMARRMAAALLMTAFFTVVCVTTAVSLGAYCLTSDAANTAALPSSYLSGVK